MSETNGTNEAKVMKSSKAKRGPGRPFLPWTVVTRTPWGDRTVTKVVSKHSTRDQAIENRDKIRPLMVALNPDATVTIEKRAR